LEDNGNDGVNVTLSSIRQLERKNSHKKIINIKINVKMCSSLQKWFLTQERQNCAK